MLLIVGLGNPGMTYKHTHHNMGFDTLDKLAERLGVTFKHRFCLAKVAEAYVGGDKIVLAKPQTYMNLSGDSVRQLLGKYHAKAEDLVVVYDDIDLDAGTIRMRTHGSAGTHNGMRSVVQAVGEHAVRLRIGVGKPQNQMPLYDYVLSRPDKDKAVVLGQAQDRACAVLVRYIECRDVGQAMQEADRD